MTPVGERAAGAERRERLEAARLYLVTAARPRGAPAEESLLPAALAGGVDVVQLRDKEADDAELVRAGRAFAAVCRAAGALLIVNDRPDLVAPCGADGVHLGQLDGDPGRARADLGTDVLVGVSTHSPEELAAACRSDADYAAVGPVFATPTKPGYAPVGVELVRHAAEVATLPFFAIGGVDRSNAAAVAEAGARRLAVVRAIRDARDPERAARALRAAVAGEVGAGAAA